MMIRYGREIFVTSAVVILAACGGGNLHSREAGAVSTTALVVKPVAWNPGNAPLGKVQAVSDDHDVVAVFSDNGATIFRSGASIAHDGATHAWTNAATIPSIDGTSQWIVATDKSGNLYYLRNLQNFEAVSDRYGFGKSHVRDAALVSQGGGKTLVGFALDNEMAIADGAQVTRFVGASFTDFSAGGSFVAGVAHDEIDVVDVEKKSLQRYPLPGAAYAAVTSDGKLYAATSRAIYGAKSGTLTLLYEADDPTIHGLVASGTHVWFADGDELGAIDDGVLSETTSKAIPADAKIASSPSGDIWVMSGSKLERFARIEVAAPNTSHAGTMLTWDSTIQPVFARSCATCHLPGGVSGTDLSTASAWNAERDAIHDRVVVKQTMPPSGHPLAAADRAAIGAWVSQTATPTK